MPRRVRRVRRRVTRSRRPHPPRMTPAMRHKISLAVKAANRRRGIGRHTSTAVARRHRVGPPAMTSAMRHKVSLGVRRAYARRHGGLRRFGGGGGLHGLSINPKTFLNKNTLTLAGGAIGAGILTNIVLNRWGASLPMATNPVGGVVYRALIPLAGAYAVRRFNRQLAEGMVLGGAILAINEAIRIWIPQVMTVASAPVAGGGEYLNAYGTVGPAEAVSQFSAAPSIYDSEPAFGDTAWS